MSTLSGADISMPGQVECCGNEDPGRIWECKEETGNDESVSLTVAAASGTVDRKDKGRKHEINSDKRCHVSSV